MKRYILIVIMSLMAFGSFGTLNVSAASFMPKTEVASFSVDKEQLMPMAEKIVTTALQYLGVRYRSGHSSPSGFDCSGLTSYVFHKLGIPLTRSSRSQFLEGSAVKKIAHLKKGDLVFFGGRRSSKRVGHVGIVTSVDSKTHSFRFIHAARTGVVVSSSSSPYYKRRYIGARRIVEHSSKKLSESVIKVKALNDSLSHFYLHR